MLRTYVKRARLALTQLGLTSKPKQWQIEFYEGFVGALQRIEHIDPYANPDTYLSPPASASEAFRIGYEEAIKTLGIEV